MLSRAPTTITFSNEAMKANLLRLQNEWEAYQSNHSVMLFTDIWPPFLNWSNGGTRRVRQATVLVGRCT
jgi:hypothetical protein